MDDDLKKTLENLHKLLQEREEALDDREKELKRLKKSLEEDYPTAGSPGDVLSLNVGGTRIDVLRKTITQIEGSMLASRFSGRWDDGLDKDKDGNFFIDQPIRLFRPMMNYLRAKSSETAFSLPAKAPVFADNEEKIDFDRMVDYYGMTQGVYPVGLHRMDTDNTTTLVAGLPDYSVRSEEWGSYCLIPIASVHVRYITSYEVTLGRHTSAQVGWMSWHHRGSFHGVTSTGKGTGYGSYSIGFDCGRSGIASNQQFTPFPNISIGEGTIFRCENKGDEWYIDGNKIASTTVQQNSAENVTRIGACSNMNTPVPCISVKGNFQVTSIEYDT